MKLSQQQAREAIEASCATVSFLDAQVGKVMRALKENVLEDNTIVIFTNDHGFHLGEYDILDESGFDG